MRPAVLGRPPPGIVVAKGCVLPTARPDACLAAVAAPSGAADAASARDAGAVGAAVDPDARRVVAARAEEAAAADAVALRVACSQ